MELYTCRFYSKKHEYLRVPSLATVSICRRIMESIQNTKEIIKQLSKILDHDTAQKKDDDKNLKNIQDAIQNFTRQLDYETKRKRDNEMEIDYIMTLVNTYEARLRAMESEQKHSNTQYNWKAPPQNSQTSKEEEDRKRQQENIRRGKDFQQSTSKTPPFQRENTFRQSPPNPQGPQPTQEKKQNYSQNAYTKPAWQSQQQQAKKPEAQKPAEEKDDMEWLKQAQEEQRRNQARNQNRPDTESTQKEQYVWNDHENIRTEMKLIPRYKELMQLVGLSTQEMNMDLNTSMKYLKDNWPTLKKLFLKWKVKHQDWMISESEHYKTFSSYQEIYDHLNEDLFPSNLSVILDLLEYRLAKLSAHL